MYGGYERDIDTSYMLDYELALRDLESDGAHTWNSLKHAACSSTFESSRALFWNPMGKYARSRRILLSAAGSLVHLRGGLRSITSGIWAVMTRRRQLVLLAKC